MRLWLDRNVELNLSREAVEEVGRMLYEAVVERDEAATEQIRDELHNACNHIRSHMQHLPPVNSITDSLLD
jgi:hypothetical protein